MPIWGTWPRKPPQGTRINTAHPLAQGLVWFSGLLEGNGATTTQSQAGYFPLPITSTSWVSYSGGVALRFNANGTIAASTTLPTRLQISPPCTILAGFRPFGGASNTCPIIGTFTTTAVANGALALMYDSALQPQLLYNAGGGSLTGGTVSANADHAVGIVTTGSSTQFYNDGVQAGTSSATVTSGTYTGTACLAMGAAPANVGRNLNAAIYWAGIWNVALSAVVMTQLTSSVNAIWQIMQPPQPWWLMNSSLSDPFPAGYFQPQTSNLTALRM